MASIVAALSLAASAYTLGVPAARSVDVAARTNTPTALLDRRAVAGLPHTLLTHYHNI